MVAHTRPAFTTFAFTHRVLDGRSVRLGYRLSGGGDAPVDFEETLDLPESLGTLASPDDPAVARALAGLHLAAGTSYWKASLPRELVIHDAALSGEDAAFWSDVYTLGLGEFFYRNQLDPTGRVAFRATPGPAAAPAATRAANGPSLLLWGGGKDSAVSHEVLRTSGEAHELLSIGGADWEWVRRSAEVAGSTLHVVTRRLDPRLTELNASGAWNGHVPVSAILAFAGTLVAALSGRGAVIASNESSASAGNASWHGIDVNHQWSKSLAFERSMRRWLARNLEGGPGYFSLLRPLTELRIVKAFATHPAYFGAVTSCNANFRQSGPAPRRFCLTCAKCVFVSLMARPWLDDGPYHALFGGDALANPSNLSIVEELLGLRGTKPFECVGTPEETIAAIDLARVRGRMVPHGVMTAFVSALARSGLDPDAAVDAAMARSLEHELPPSRVAQLDDYLDSH